MNKKIICLSLLTSTFAFAETSLDKEFRTIGVVDKNYKVIDVNKYNNLWRIVSNDMAKMMPIQLDADTTVLSLILNKNLYLMTMQINTDLNNIKIDQSYLNTAKHNFCNTPYGMSQVIKRNGGMDVKVTVMNNHYRIIYNYGFHSSECDK